MEHKTRDEIRDVADILPSYLQARPLSKLERLELWVEALEREGGRRLRTLFEIEHAASAKRAGLRADDSPLSVAFDDPRLRARRVHEVPRTMQRLMPCLACRGGADPYGRRLGRHCLAVVAEAQNIVHLQLADPEEGSSVASQRMSGKANGWYHSDFVEILPTILEHRALKSHGVGIESVQLLFRSKRVVR